MVNDDDHQEQLDVSRSLNITAFVPFRMIAMRELGSLLGVLSHPHRLMIVEELRAGERDVATLAAALGVSPSGVSQHLTPLRLIHVVTERREARHVFYRLCDPELATWLLSGFKFVKDSALRAEDVAQAVTKAQTHWAME